MAFSAGNLLPVARDLRATYSETKIIICGDNDKSGVGQAKAKEAADAVRGLVSIPETEGEDWNDVHVRCGLEGVKQAIRSDGTHIRSALYPLEKPVHTCTPLRNWHTTLIFLRGSSMRCVYVGWWAKCGVQHCATSR